jgi:lipid-A-disaccharide synthase
MSQIFVAAGEASGDHYGAGFIRAMREREAGCTFAGLAGPEMRAAGCSAIVNAEDVAHMGLTEVLAHAPQVYGRYRKLVRHIESEKPRLAVLIDFPDVNFRLARRLHALGVPVLYFVSPQLWAWKKRRLRWVKRWVTRMLVIFPFEEAFYRERGVAAEFVGHPLADLPLPEQSRESYAAEHDLLPGKPWIALLPGSRKSEFAHNFPEMVCAAKLLPQEFEFVVPVAPTISADFVARIKAKLPEWAHGSDVAARMSFVTGAPAALYHAHASVVASGTATVLAALMGNPFVIVYRMTPLSFAIAKSLVDVPFIGMPNLIAGRAVVPELVQADFTAENVARVLTPLLREGPERGRMRRDLAEVRAALTTAQGTAVGRAADIALAMLKS